MNADATSLVDRYRQLVEQRAYKRRIAALGVSAAIAPYIRTTERTDRTDRAA